MTGMFYKHFLFKTRNKIQKYSFKDFEGEEGFLKASEFYPILSI